MTEGSLSITGLTAQERGQPRQGHTKATLRSRVNQQELWEAGSVLMTGCGDPWSPPEDMAGLFEGFCRLELKPATSNAQALRLVPLIPRAS